MGTYAFNFPAVPFAYHQSVDLFLFCPLSRKEKKFPLCELCVSSEAGGE